MDAEFAPTAGSDQPDGVDDQRGVSTLELFFDLVFVFTLTQLTAMLEQDVSVETFLRVVLVFVVLFWMYGGYAWLTNQVPPDRVRHRLLLVAGMVAFMVTALAVPGVFDDTGVTFGVGYLLVVLVHAALYVETSGTAVLRLLPLNLLGAVALIVAGLVDGPMVYALWLAPIVLQYVTSLLVGQVDEETGTGFRVRPAHFVERHGLLLIVALGESVVAVGIGLGDASLDALAHLTAAVGLALAAGMWWVYFVEDDDGAEAAMSAASVPERIRMALQGYFYSYLPMLLAVVVVAAGVAHAVGHPGESVDVGHGLLLGGGVAMYLLGNAAFRRSLGLAPVGHRVGAAVVAVASLPVGVSVSALAQLVTLVAVLVVMLLLESRRATPAVPAQV